jgi:hypothetical protein
VASLTAEASVKVLLQSAKTLAAIAARAQVTLVFLKGLAPHLAGVTAPGTRRVSDIDVLFARDQAGVLVKCLRDNGYKQWTTRDNEHHMPPFTGPAAHLSAG